MSNALVRDVLAEYGDATLTVIRGALERAAARDPVYGIAADYPLRGGRALRASTCIAAARAHGAALDTAVATAASLELLHSAFLVRDDVEDESEERRGRPALHRIHGVATAVNAGDALTVLGLEPLLQNRTLLGTRVAFRVLEEAALMVRESVEGQALELRWRSENALDLCDDDYLRLVLKKTAWYTTIYPLRVGALIGARGKVDVERFVRFGFLLGAAFQIQDDLLNLVGDPARYGKELNGDIAEGKRTLMLLHLLRVASTAERARLAALLRAPRAGRSAEAIAWVRERMDHHGSIDRARRHAHALAGAALHEAPGAFSGARAGRDLRFLQSLPTWVLERR